MWQIHSERLFGCSRLPSVTPVHLGICFHLVIGSFLQQCIEWDSYHLSASLFIQISGCASSYFSRKTACSEQFCLVLSFIFPQITLKCCFEKLYLLHLGTVLHLKEKKTSLRTCPGQSNSDPKFSGHIGKTQRGQVYEEWPQGTDVPILYEAKFWGLMPRALSQNKSLSSNLWALLMSWAPCQSIDSFRVHCLI